MPVRISTNGSSESMDERLAQQPASFAEMAFEDILSACETKPPANANLEGDAPILSDILGFKFAHYQVNLKLKRQQHGAHVENL